MSAAHGTGHGTIRCMPWDNPLHAMGTVLPPGLPGGSAFRWSADTLPPLCPHCVHTLPTYCPRCAHTLPTWCPHFAGHCSHWRPAHHLRVAPGCSAPGALRRAAGRHGCHLAALRIASLATWPPRHVERC
eukprot:326831-Chlamydomonas_euryale.AAC.2